ncbi:MAG: extensin family protein [Amaricoccus sp.]|uniref:extensin family protein n=1 Tax=Amaricoccus sp. TaxID=1872485 RepID=UPI0039E41D1B
MLALTVAGAFASRVADAPPPRPAPVGPVCDSDALVGARLPPIAGPGGCGVAAPVELDFAAGVALDPPAVVTCGAARALAAWLVTAVRPAVAATGGRLAAQELAGAYVCRGRNGPYCR